MLVGSYTAAQDQRLTQCHSMLQQIMTHLAFLMFLIIERSPPQTQPHWMFWPQQQLLQTHHHHSSEVVRFLLYFCIVTSFINCLLIFIWIYVLAIVGSDTFVCLALYSCTSHFGYIKGYSVYIYTDFCTSCFVPSPCVIVFLFN